MKIISHLKSDMRCSGRFSWAILRFPVMRALASLVFLLHVPGLRAAVVTWDGGGGDNSWHNPLNWTGDTLPTTTDSAVIDAVGTTIKVIASTEINALTLASLE